MENGREGRRSLTNGRHADESYSGEAMEESEHDWSYARLSCLTSRRVRCNSIAYSGNRWEHSARCWQMCAFASWYFVAVTHNTRVKSLQNV